MTNVAAISAAGLVATSALMVALARQQAVLLAVKLTGLQVALSIKRDYEQKNALDIW